MFATITKSERNGPVFCFFMDLGDAVTYVKQLNIPSGVVGACRLDLAYDHFKEKPHLFQFVPNEKQIFADMEELGVRPNVSIVSMMGNVFQKLGMSDKYEKLMKKYPPPKWEYLYIKGKRVGIQAKPKYELDSAAEGKTNEMETAKNPNESSEQAEAAANLNESFEEIEANTNELLDEAEANSSEIDISSTSNLSG